MKLRNEEDSMKIYKVYWEDILIGTLSVNNNMHRYIPNLEGKKWNLFSPVIWFSLL